jgi:hypothetical protein
MELKILHGRQPKELLRIPSPSGDWECQGTLVAKMYTFFIELQKLIGGHDDGWGWIRNFEITQTDITAIRE